MKLILFLILSCLTFAQEVRWQPDADTTEIRNKGLTTPAEIVAGLKSKDSLFLNPARFKDNASFDSTLILKSGIKDNNTGATIDSFKFSSNYDFLRLYLSGYGSEDTLIFFSSTGDSLEIWAKDMLFKAPKNLPLVT